MNLRCIMCPFCLEDVRLLERIWFDTVFLQERCFIWKYFLSLKIVVLQAENLFCLRNPKFEPHVKFLEPCQNPSHSYLIGDWWFISVSNLFDGWFKHWLSYIFEMVTSPVGCPFSSPLLHGSLAQAGSIRQDPAGSSVWGGATEHFFCQSHFSKTMTSLWWLWWKGKV